MVVVLVLIEFAGATFDRAIHTHPTAASVSTKVNYDSDAALNATLFNGPLKSHRPNVIALAEVKCFPS